MIRFMNRFGAHMFTSSSSRTSCRRSAAALLIGGLFSLSPIGPAPATARPLATVETSAPTLKLSNGEVRSTRHVAGDDLYVEVLSALPSKPVELRLVDGFSGGLGANPPQDMGFEVASFNVTTDTVGHLDPTLLWFRSGVVGCDDHSRVDPLELRFESFDQAELFLPAARLQVLLLDIAGDVLALVGVPVDIPHHQTRYFFSNSQGCPRSVFDEDENIYLSARQAYPGTLNTALFFVDTDHPLTEAGEIDERRALYAQVPQVLSANEGAGEWTTLMWPAQDTVPGLYGGLVRLFSGWTGYTLEDTDFSVGAFFDDGSRGLHGIRVREWECPPEQTQCVNKDD